MGWLILLADEGNWIAGVISLVSAAAAAILGIYQYRNKQKLSELDYIFGKHKEIVKRVEREHAEDKAVIAVLQDKEVKCRAELATMTERVANLERDLQRQQQQGKGP
jgi:septation ring formation regulator EzrA